MMETQNNFIFAILMLISTCSQNLMNTVNELSTDNNLENKKNVEYEVLINEEALRISLGPCLAPGLFVVPPSHGTPQIQ